MELKYTATKIAQAEKKTKENFFDVLGSLSNNPSISGLLFLFNAGGGTDDEFDALFKQGVGKVLSCILEGLGNSGFLTKEAVEEATKELAKLNSQEVSQVSGETTNV